MLKMFYKVLWRGDMLKMFMSRVDDFCDRNVYLFARSRKPYEIFNITSRAFN